MKNIKALLFGIDNYDKCELDSMNAKELYELASTASTIGYDEACVLSLEELADRVNSDAISVDQSWLYFVNLED